MKKRIKLINKQEGYSVKWGWAPHKIQKQCQRSGWSNRPEWNWFSTFIKNRHKPVLSVIRCILKFVVKFIVIQKFLKLPDFSCLIQLFIKGGNSVEKAAVWISFGKTSVPQHVFTELHHSGQQRMIVGRRIPVDIFDDGKLVIGQRDVKTAA